MFKLPIRKPESHKGEVGKVMIVAGSSTYYGAPVICALAAEKSGADLITLCLPPQHIETAKNYSLNFFLQSYVQSNLGLKDLGFLLGNLKRNDCLIIGPGLGRDTDTQRAVRLLLEEASIPVVLDAEALFSQILDISPKSQWVLTPHADEFKRVFGKSNSEQNIKKSAQMLGYTILVKGKEDHIAFKEQYYINKTGCAEMRVGGTGDALAGIVGSFIAQGLNAYDAACSAAYYFGKAGQELTTQRKFFSAYDLVQFFPQFLSLSSCNK